MANLLDVYQLTLNQTYSGKDMKNVFFYERTPSGSGTASDLVAGFLTEVLPFINAIENTFVFNLSVEAFNILDLEDFVSGSPLITGGDILSTSPGPRFLSYGFRYHRSTRQGRDGSKRFPGVSEELIDATGTSTAPPLTAAIATLRDRLITPFAHGGVTYSPRIPLRELMVNINPPPPTSYVLVNALPLSNVSFTGLTTQNTRKR